MYMYVLLNPKLGSTRCCRRTSRRMSSPDSRLAPSSSSPVSLLPPDPLCICYIYTYTYIYIYIYTRHFKACV